MIVVRIIQKFIPIQKQQILNQLKAVIILLLFTVYSEVIFSQKSINGTVRDSVNNISLKGVSIAIGKKGYHSDNNGDFSIVFGKDSIDYIEARFSHIGYFPKTIKIRGGELVVVNLSPEIKELPLVTISTGAEKIVERSIEQIGVNYPTNHFSIIGILRTHQSVRDSVIAKRYFSSDAVLKINYPSYLLPGYDPIVSMLQNKEILLIDKLNKVDVRRWINAYLLVPKNDFVHSQPDFFSRSGLKKFSYHLREKKDIDSLRVYVIDFYSKKNNKQEGTIYIDTISYAVVAATFSFDNVRPPFSTIIKQKKVSLKYTQLQGKWYLDNIKSTIFYSNKDNNEYFRIVDFKMISIDSIDIKKIPASEKIEEGKEDTYYSKTSGEGNWQYLDSIFTTETANGYISPVQEIPVNLLKNNLSKSGKESFLLSNVLSYLHNNYTSYIGINSSPVWLSANGIQEKKKISESANFSLQLSGQLSIYKKFFVYLFTGSNLGIGGITTKFRSYNIGYSLSILPSKRPIVLSPFLGYMNYKIKIGQEKIYKAEYGHFGFILSKKLSRNLSLFIQTTNQFYFLKEKKSTKIQPRLQDISACLGINFNF